MEKHPLSAKKKAQCHKSRCQYLDLYNKAVGFSRRSLTVLSTLSEYMERM